MVEVEFSKTNLPSRIIVFIFTGFLFFYFYSFSIIDNNQNSCPFGTFTGIAVTNDNTRDDIDTLGVSSIHIWIHWDYIEPQLFAPLIRVEDVTEEMVRRYNSSENENIDWSVTDSIMNELKGLEMIVGIGSGWKVDMPYYNDVRITPDNIGREYYLGQLYLFTRSCIRRYGSQVIGWQIENEPNIGTESVVFGIRKGQSWLDKNFVTEVLQTLEKAVRIEAPEAWITINFHTDIHYESDIKNWLPLVDIVSIDAYPNYFTGDPIKPDEVLKRIKHVKKISKGKPVLVMETGYPSAPDNLGFSEKNQERYIDKIFANIYEAGACGAFIFKLSTPEEENSSAMPQDNYGGLIRKNGTFKASWYTFKEYLKK